ncbi:MAG TPA: hypothetical protein VF796_04760, partial [Humisphaera sp.]
MRMIETLEERRLFACTIALDAYGTLNVTSDLTGDTIAVSEKLGTATVTVGGVSKGSFAGVKRVVVRGGGGTDTITFTGYSVGADIFGDDGIDTINLYDYRVGTTTGFSTASGGVGADKITSYAGEYAVLHGDGDNDTITVQGSKYIKVYGDAGTDAIYVNSGA